MKPQDLDKLPRAENGAPIVTLMQDPDMGLAGSEGFLSLVDRGANGRRITVAKADSVTNPGGSDSHTHAIKAGSAVSGPGGADGHTHALSSADRTGETNGHTHQVPATAAKAEDMQASLEVVADLGQQPGGSSWWRRLFGGLLGLAEPVAKGGPPTSFDEAVVVPAVLDHLWEGFRALEDAVFGILGDDEIADKQQAIEISVAQFGRYLSQAFSQIPVLKGEHADRGPAIAQIAQRVRAEKAASVIADVDPATIDAARSALSEASLALEAVAKGRNTSKPAKGDDEDEDMNAEQIAKVAKAAADNAVAVAKSANPSLTPAQLQAIGVEASQAVFKAAVMGPAQPGIPTTTLQGQIAEGAGVSGNIADPMAAITGALNKITSLTAKVDKSLDNLGAVLGVDLENGKTVALKDDKSNAGIAHVLAAQGSALEQLGERVAKVAGTPRPSNGGGDQPGQTRVEKVAANDDGVWGGTAFDFNAPTSTSEDVSA